MTLCAQVQAAIMAGNATLALKEYAIMTGSFWCVLQPPSPCACSAA